MVGQGFSRPVIAACIMILVLIGPTFVPMLGGNGNASAAIVDEFVKDRQSKGQVDLHFRQPGLKDKAWISVPRDGQVIKGSFDAEAVEWTTQGSFEHNSSGDFLSGSSTEHVKVDNGSVRLEDVTAELSLSSVNSWGHGLSYGLDVGNELSLKDKPGMAFLWDNVISNASNEQDLVVLKVDSQGLTHCVYEDNSKGLDIYYARSEDGLHYSAFKTLDNPLNSRFIPQEDPAMAIDAQDAIHVVYADGRTTPNDLDIFYTYSTDHGDHFSTEVRVDNGGTAVQKNPSTAVDRQGNIYIAWEDTRDGNTTIYYSKNFGQETRVSLSGKGFQSLPKLAVDTNGNVHIVWRDNRSAKDDWRIYHAMLTPGGTAFKNEALIYWIYYGFGQYWQVIEPGDNGRMFIAWTDNRTFEFNVYLTYTDDGLTFAEPLRITPMLVRALYPGISYRDGTLHLTWYDFRDNYISHVYYLNTTDVKKFSPTVRVDHANGTSRAKSPAIAAGKDGWPRIAWVDFRQHQSGDLFTTVGAPNHTSNGTLEVWSDLGSTPYKYNGAEIVGEIPVGASVLVMAQTSPDNITWSAPVRFTNDSANVTPGRYLHLVIEVKTNNSAFTPYITEISIHYRRFAPVGTLISMDFTMDHPVSRVIATWGAPNGDDGVTLSVSQDGGLSWTELDNGIEAIMAGPTNRLNYKLDLVRMDFGSPQVEWLRLDYTEHSYPRDVSITVGDTRIWRFNGEFTDKATVSNLAKAINDYLGSLGPSSGDDNVSVPIEVTSGQLGDMALKGLSVDIALPPKITGSGPGSSPEAEEGQSVIFWISVSERDGRPLTYKWTVDNEALDNETRYTMTYVVPYTGTAPRTDRVSVVVSNGYLEAQRTWELNVQPSNRPPVIVSQMPELESIVVNTERKFVDFLVNASDPDGDPLTYTWTLDGTQQGTNSNGLTLEPSKISTGDHSVRVEVSDGKSKAAVEWTLIVLPAGKPGTEDGSNYMVFFAILAMVVVILCGVAFMEAYRRARGSRRAMNKRVMVQEEREAVVPPAMASKRPVKKKGAKVRR